LAAQALEKWTYNPNQQRGYGGRFGSGGGPAPAVQQQPAAAAGPSAPQEYGPRGNGPGKPPAPAKKPAAKPSTKPAAQGQQPGANEVSPGEKKVNQLLTQAQNLDKEAATISKKITALRKEQKAALAAAKKASAPASSSPASSAAQPASAAQANVSGTAAGSTSSTSAAQSTTSLAASYTAKAKAIGAQIHTLQTKVNSLHAQAKQLRAQASQVKHVVPEIHKGADVATTLTEQPDATVSFPILKTETTADGDLVVYGKATDGTLDSDEQIVDPAWSSKALQNWLSTGANLRVQHNPQRDPAGIGLQVDMNKDNSGAHWLKALVVEPVAKRLVSKGALRAFSVGIMKPRIVTDPKARGGRIVDGELGEVSLVDRPANRNCSFTLVKADKTDGHAEWVGELNGDPEFMAKATAPSPTDVARMVNKRAVEAPPEMPEVQQGDVPLSVFSEPVANRLAEALKRVKANGEVVDSSGKDRSDVAGGDFAGPGKTFPIESQDDVPDAASLAHHAKDPGAVRSRIRSIAQRKWPGMTMPPSLASKGELDELPSALIKQLDLGTLSLDDAYKAITAAADLMKGDGGDCSTCHGTGKILEGNRRCPDCQGSGNKIEWAAEITKGGGLANFGGHQSKPYGAGGVKDDDDDDKPDNADDSGEAEDDVKQAVPATVKMFCPNCGSKMKKKGAFCPGCGSKVAMPDETKHVIPHSHPTPGDGVKGKDTEPAARHREPDGDQVEDFEHDSGMEDGDEHGSGKPPEPAPTWGKKGHSDPDPADGVDNKKPTERGPGKDEEKERPEAEFEVKMRTTEAPYTMMRAHDAVCAAYNGAEVLAEYPSLKGYTDAIDIEQWRDAARATVDGGNLADAQKALAVASAAETLSKMDPEAVADGRAALHKNFASMYPSVHLSPGSISPTQFKRPYISAGHSPLSAEAPKGQPDGHIPPSAPHADAFTRGPLTAGHEAVSPANGGTRTVAMATGKSAAMGALTVVHDEIANLFPELCPMGTTHVTPSGKSAPVSDGIAAQLRSHSQRSGSTHEITKSETPVVPVIRARKNKAAGSDNALLAQLVQQNEQLIKAVNSYNAANEFLTKQVSDLTDRDGEYSQTINKMQAELDHFGRMPDPMMAPLRSATSYGPDDASSGAVPAERRSLVDEAANKVRAEKLMFFKSLAASGDPQLREGAEQQIAKLLGAP
jgi:hypothetical protein